MYMDILMAREDRSPKRQRSTGGVQVSIKVECGQESDQELKLVAGGR